MPRNLSSSFETSPQISKHLLKFRNLSSSFETSPQVSKPPLKFQNLSSSFETSPQVSKHLLKFETSPQVSKPHTKSCKLGGVMYHLLKKPLPKSRNLIFHADKDNMHSSCHVLLSKSHESSQDSPQLMHPLLESNNLA